MNTQVIDKVVEQLKSLPYDLQRQVLEFTRVLALSVPRGVAGKQLLLFAGTIPFSDVDLMREAIEQGCEQVDAHEW
ncbi:MAG: hypothetical protein NUW24_06860 [Anaerolineae bacterium]|jgi:hypothetical protein|nr:hypothetical protein [Anaerolineae bacterium]